MPDAVLAARIVAMAIDDSDADVREAACDALAQMGESAAVHELWHPLWPRVADSEQSAPLRYWRVMLYCRIADGPKKTSSLS